MKFKIQKLRESKKMSQEQLAKLSGVSRVVISGLETGNLKNTTAITMKKIADALGVKITDIFLD